MSYTEVRISKEPCWNTTPKHNNCIKSSRPQELGREIDRYLSEGGLFLFHVGEQCQNEHAEHEH